MNPTCPECNAPEDDLDGLNVIDITTPEDRDLGLKRYALRCQNCGYASAFVGKPI